MPITEILAKNAQLYSHDVCLVELNPEAQENNEKTWKEFDLVESNLYSEWIRREMTWRQFDRSANQFANLLLARQLGKGKKVALLLMNSLEWLPLYFGILKTGAIVVPINFRFTSDEILYCLELAEADALVFGPEFIERVESICDKIPRVKDKIFVGQDCPSFAEDYYRHITSFSKEAPDIPLNDTEDAAIYFSSGTTGFPKAILHHHRSLVFSCEVEQDHHGQTKDDIFLCIPPLYHTGAMMHWLGSFLVGGRGVLLRGTLPQWIIRAVAEENVTIVWLLVPWAQDILDAIDSGEINLDDFQLDQWRMMHIGAQPVPPSLVRRWLERFPHHQYDTNYGLSESIGPGCVHLGIENIHKVGAIGKAGYGWKTDILNEWGESLPSGKIGELLVQGPGVMRCYYRNQEATAETLKDDWLYTGDMAKTDEDGFIYLVDRKKDVIIMGGENIYPIQIEDFLRAHHAIKDVAVIGFPHDRLGEIPGAIIEIKPNCSLTEEEVLEFCTPLPRYKRPRKVIFDQVPRNPTGKIEKLLLRKKYHTEGLIQSQTEK